MSCSWDVYGRFPKLGILVKGSIGDILGIYRNIQGLGVSQNTCPYLAKLPYNGRKPAQAFEIFLSALRLYWGLYWGGRGGYYTDKKYNSILG